MIKNHPNDLPTVDTEINGVTFETTVFDAETGITLLTKLFKLMGPSLVRMFQHGLGAQVTGEMLSQAVGELATRLSEAEVKAVIDELLDPVRANGVSLRNGGWKKYFGGKLGLMMRVLVWSTKENFADFLSDAGALQQVAQAVTGSRSQTT